MEQTGLPARRAAHYILQQITTEGRLMSEVIGAGALERLGPDDRARAQRLATQTLRAFDRADRMLKPFLKKTPPDFVRNALRLGTVELMDGSPAHGVVNAYVELVSRNKRSANLKGLTNAVLRKVDNAGRETWDKLTVPVMRSWLRQPLVAAWGRPAMAGIEAAHFRGAPLDLTAKSDAGALAAELGGALLPTGSVRLESAGQVSQLPGYDSGNWWVQDAAAALPVKLLGDVGGLSVVDLCAAPGGKTLQLAAGGANVIAVDASANRMERVTQNLTRTGLTAEAQVADAFAVKGSFDAVLLDAPCSATGTIRRHPDLPYAKDGSEFAALIDQQGRLIDHAITLLRPGGRLVYCTCSLLPDEGEVQAEEALSRHANLTADVAALEIAGVDAAWITPEGGLRLRPDYWVDLGGMDGFYMIVLTKAA